MNLVLDIGNTSCKIYIFNGWDIIHKSVCSDLSNSDISELVSGYDIRHSVISTTRERDVELEDFLGREICRVLYFDPAVTAIPISSVYGTPQTLGADRLAAAVEAAHRFPKAPIMIMDFGTALTIDFVSAEGVFIGGNISLGLSARFEALHNLTARLPLLAPPQNWTMEIGSSTISAIEQGVMQSMWYEIEGYISRNSDKITLFTSGDAIFFEKLLKNAIFADYELVPKGLNRILRYNVEKNHI